jgi:transposase-like protein
MRVQNHREYDRTFKEDALALLRRSERTINAVARDLGVPPSTLDYWYKADMAKKRRKAAANGKAPCQASCVSSRAGRGEVVRGGP